MPVVGTPVPASGSSGLSPDDIRMFLRDYAPKNPLLADVEFSDSEVSAALSSAVDHANVIGRPTNYSVANFPNKYVLKIGTASYLLKSEAFRQLRNEATYQDGNIQPVGIDNKQSGYAQLSAALSQEFIQLVTSVKIAQNMIVRGSRSPLRGLNTWT